jgi:NhaP-type Na+/H+ or K+/H+ antiporter
VSSVTVISPYLLFIAAEELGVSGILAAVVSGLYLGSRDHELTNAGTRLQAFGFWTVLTFMLESLLFVLVGLQFPLVVDRVGEQGVGDLLVAGVVLSLVVMAVRLLHQFTVLEVDERIGGREPIGWRDRLVVGWSGMRGAISLAVALAVPISVAGRDEIIFLTICVIGVTLIVQGLTLPVLIRRIGFEEEEVELDARRPALVRFRTVEAALARIGELSFERDGLDPAVLERARSLYASRAGQLAGECRTGVAEETSDTAAWLRLRLDLLDVEREALIALRTDGQITNALTNAGLSDLDLEVERLQRRMVPA